MQSGSRYIIATGIGTLGLSLLYFLSLVLHIPFFITVPVIFVCVLFVFWWVVKGIKPVDSTVQQPFWALLVLLLCLFLIVGGVLPVADKYGGWDAWGIWNLHAKYLADPDNWKKMFQNISFAHPDYPLYVPAVVGFFLRLFSEKYLEIIPFIFSFSIMLFIPVLIYFENLRKNIAVAAIIFFLFALDSSYLKNGTSQYADTPLAFFFLCAFICLSYAHEDRKYITLSAVCLGGCIWAKNEGSILALLFIVFNMKLFFSRKNIKAFAAGMAIPLFFFLLFKICYAPDAAILSGQNKETFNQLFIKDRYDLVWDYFKDNVAHKFYYVKICVFNYLLLCVLERKWPDKQFLLLVCCAIAYTMVYVLTPGGIEWLLGTSQERLMHQLMPALMYVLSQRFVRVQFSLPKQEVL